jgi:sortase B
MSSLSENPRKKNTRKISIRKWLKLLTIMTVVVFILSGYNLFILKNQSYENSKKTNLITKLYIPKNSNEIETVEEGQVNQDIQVNPFDKLLNENPDTKAWLTIPSTNIDYVVVQKKQPNVSSSTDYYYLHRDFYGKYSQYGTLFFDDSDSIDKNFTSQNLTIYGHHMKDGQMFGQLKNYRDKSYCLQHLNINLNTIYGDRRYQIFSVLLTPAVSTIPTDNSFNYVQADFQTQDEFIQFVNRAKEKSIHNIPVSVGKGDQILTLSTCEYDYENARLVVMAKIIN